MASSPPFKRRRRGGTRQRQEMARKDEDDNREPGDDDNIGHGDLSAATKMPSKLIRHTLKKFAWGVVSAQEAQQIAECSKKDFDNFKKATSSSQSSGSKRESLRPAATHPIEQDLRSVASIGVQGQYSNKCYVDLMKKIEANMTLPLPHRERMRFKAPLGEQVQEILLPHEFFASLWEHDATFHKVVVPEPDICKKFWKTQKAAKHPALDGHPLQHLNDEQLNMMVPISLHGDEVPVTGIGKQWSRKMVNFSWHSMVSTTSNVQDSQFFIWALFDKVGITEGEYRTINHFFEILRWSFDCLFQGTWPTSNFLGQGCLGLCDITATIVKAYSIFSGEHPWSL